MQIAYQQVLGLGQHKPPYIMGYTSNNWYSECTYTGSSIPYHAYLFMVYYTQRYNTVPKKKNKTPTAPPCPSRGEYLCHMRGSRSPLPCGVDPTTWAPQHMRG